MTETEINLLNRDWLVGRLRSEIVGPDPADPKIAIRISFGEDRDFVWDEFRKPKLQPDGEEILWQDAPSKRYGAGVLFPGGVTELVQLEDQAEDVPEDADGSLPVDDDLVERPLDDGTGRATAPDESENYEVSMANSYRPSAMGISLLLDLTLEKIGVDVIVDFAKYRRKSVKVGSGAEGGKGSQRDLWFRTACRPDANPARVRISTADLLSGRRRLPEINLPGLESEALKVVAFTRPNGRGQTLLTVSIVNQNAKDAGRLDELCYYQCGFKVVTVGRTKAILPYPEADLKDQDHEDAFNRLMYRDCQTFGIGHGCSADWDGPMGDGVPSVWTEVMPAHETPSTSPDVLDSDGKPMRVSMRKLAGFDPEDDGTTDIMALIGAYEGWIATISNFESPQPAQRNVPRPPIPDNLRHAADELVLKCRNCLARIREGWMLLNGSDKLSRQARTAFKLANEAMLVSQLRQSRAVRLPAWDEGSQRTVWDTPAPRPDPRTSSPDRGFWRPFQIAFLLMSIKGIVDPSANDREIVDLIWFPTGGGKTEAYFGLSAFTLLFNRLAGKRTSGTDIIMRYTLRLLTAQQFQRAALLMCSIDDVRNRNTTLLGTEPFRLGMWVGGDTTPNTREGAISMLKALQKNHDGENPFILLKCPWCQAHFGPPPHTKGRQTHRRDSRGTYGYQNIPAVGARIATVIFKCDDRDCDYHRRPLPVVIIDEDIYADPPSMVIATVDKFALLAWKPQVRALFGIGSDGSRAVDPPSLIIQDELHLISGPLGSMVGAYETLIELLCSSEKGGIVRKPKIVASTATISRAGEQVKGLFCRTDMRIFPPTGLEAGDSFFARDAREPNGKRKRGRLYLGVLATAHGSQQTTLARLFGGMIQWPAAMPVTTSEHERDPWWTTMAFFNSLRELGGAATLLVADARDYQRVILDRHGLPYTMIRPLWNWRELTSRIRGDQIPKYLQDLEIPFRPGMANKAEAIEACLASNIIEVGVDIDRLSLMIISGQPKTTSQYIQVSSRVGRRTDAPGLVLINYNPSKPRDRSHYERFRSYHERLYAQVEPTSVTPFSPPAVDRTLHAIMVGMVRQLGGSAEASSPRPFPLAPGSKMRLLLEKTLLDRVRLADPEEEQYLMERLRQRLSEWLAWNPVHYGDFGPPSADPPLLFQAGSSGLEGWFGRTWSTLSSLRNVDASCEAEITSRYNQVEDTGVA